MIVYKDVVRQLYDAGYTNKFLRDEKLLSQSVLTSLRRGKHINTDTINTICLLLGCQPNDIIEVAYDNELAEECRAEMEAAIRQKRDEADSPKDHGRKTRNARTKNSKPKGKTAADGEDA